MEPLEVYKVLSVAQCNHYASRAHNAYGTGPTCHKDDKKTNTVATRCGTTPYIHKYGSTTPKGNGQTQSKPGNKAFFLFLIGYYFIIFNIYICRASAERVRRNVSTPVYFIIVIIIYTIAECATQCQHRWLLNYFSNVYVSRMCDAMSALDCIIYLFIYFKCMYSQAQNVQTNLSVRRPARVPYLVCVAPPHSLTDVQLHEIWPSGWLSCKSRDLQVCWDGYHPMSIALADFARNPCHIIFYVMLGLAKIHHRIIDMKKLLMELLGCDAPQSFKAINNSANQDHRCVEPCVQFTGQPQNFFSNCQPFKRGQ